MNKYNYHFYKYILNKNNTKRIYKRKEINKTKVNK